ncbi:hypothetical protein HFO82_28065 [Rhizobium leguminosarum]|nr:hypothetical protein [Rhizobium leguminosarum]
MSVLEADHGLPHLLSQCVKAAHERAIELRTAEKLRSWDSQLDCTRGARRQSASNLSANRKTTFSQA